MKITRALLERMAREELNKIQETGPKQQFRAGMFGKDSGGGPVGKVRERELDEIVWFLDEVADKIKNGGKVPVILRMIRDIQIELSEISGQAEDE